MALAEDLGPRFERFVLHDVRRTGRTMFSKLRVPSEVAEALLAHAKPGLHKVYDLHDRLTERSEALTLWHNWLRDLNPPAPDNVVPLRA